MDTIKLKRFLELNKLIVLFAVFVYFLFSLFHPDVIRYRDTMIMILIVTSGINMLYLMAFNPFSQEKTFSSAALANFIWFVFLKYVSVFKTLGLHNDITGHELSTVFTVISLVFVFLYFYFSLRKLLNIKGEIKLRPQRLIALSFGGVILVGTLLLFLPVSRQSGQPPLSLLNAFFTATSAVCVTGLVVVDTPTYFTLFGQIVILVMIQIGALGIMTFAGFFTVILGEKMSLFGKFTTQNAVNEMKSSGMSRYLIAIISTTLIIEMIGAGLLFIRFHTEMSVAKAIYFSIFHAVSAFCNAGFALYSDSLVSFRSDALINGVIMGLIILGGLGFSVIVNVRRRISGKDRLLTLHSRLVLFASLLLIFLGALVFYLLERNNLLANLPIGQQIMGSFFSSVTTRTAGFNTLNYGHAREATLFVMSILMFIGASPGSTGGGIKTTTFMVMLFTVMHTLREQPVIRVFGRDLHMESIRKTLVLFFLALSWVFLITIIISASENIPFSKVVFETVSAFGTVGLSTGITSHLSATSKIMLILSMFLGRVGPITLMFSLGVETNKSLVGRPVEKVQIG